jgi:hypothetical protein
MLLSDGGTLDDRAIRTTRTFWGGLRKPLDLDISLCVFGCFRSQTETFIAAMHQWSEQFQMIAVLLSAGHNGEARSSA